MKNKWKKSCAMALAGAMVLAVPLTSLAEGVEEPSALPELVQPEPTQPEELQEEATPDTQPVEPEDTTDPINLEEPATPTEGESILKGGVTYTVNADTTTVKLTGVDETVSSLEIPASITEQGKTFQVTEVDLIGAPPNLTAVTSGEGSDYILGHSAFMGAPLLKQADLSGCTALGVESFYRCTALETVTLSQTITIIPESAFGTCTNLTSINLDNISIIQDGAFAMLGDGNEEGATSQLNNISLPNCTEIGIQAFVMCSSLTELSLPKMQTIGMFAFTGCDQLTLTFPAQTEAGEIPSIGGLAFGAFDIDFNGSMIHLPAAKAVQITAASQQELTAFLEAEAQDEMGDTTNNLANMKGPVKTAEIASTQAKGLTLLDWSANLPAADQNNGVYYLSAEEAKGAAQAPTEVGSTYMVAAHVITDGAASQNYAYDEANIASLIQLNQPILPDATYQVKVGDTMVEAVPTTADDGTSYLSFAIESIPEAGVAVTPYLVSSPANPNQPENSSTDVAANTNTSSNVKTGDPLGLAALGIAALGAVGVFIAKKRN